MEQKPSRELTEKTKQMLDNVKTEEIKPRMALNQSVVEKSLKEIIEDFQYKKAAKKTIAVFTDRRNWIVETSVSALKKLDGNTTVEAHIVEMAQDYSVAISI